MAQAVEKSGLSFGLKRFIVAAVTLAILGTLWVTAFATAAPVAFAVAGIATVLAPAFGSAFT